MVKPNTEPKGVCFDLEGPLSPEDFAHHVFSRVVGDGDLLYRLLSRYDDILALELRREKYQPGDTLALILPFLVANGLTSESLAGMVSNCSRILRGSRDTLRRCRDTFQAVAVITTSYEPFAREICRRLEVPESQIYCTELPKSLAAIAPSSAFDAIASCETRLLDTFRDINIDDQSATALIVSTFDAVFSQEFPDAHVPYPTTLVRPRGGQRKVDAITHLSSATSIPPKDLAFVGDSITDVAAFQFVSEAGGLAISFNGNRYALLEADVSVAGDSLAEVLPIVEAWQEGGRDSVRSLCQRSSGEQPVWLKGLDSGSFESIVRRDAEVRVKVRGAPGDLG
jgi:energy-converting hydrogenase A subunit R